MTQGPVSFIHEDTAPSAAKAFDPLRADSHQGGEENCRSSAESRHRGTRTLAPRKGTVAMLHEFLTTHRDAILASALAKLSHRCWPPVTNTEVERGIPLLFAQLCDTMRGERRSAARSPEAIGGLEVHYANALRQLDLTLEQVVHDYGEICEAIIKVAAAQHITIVGDDLEILRRCLDSATAEATADHSWVSRKLEMVE
jgi:hypothetical protein